MVDPAEHLQTLVSAVNNLKAGGYLWHLSDNHPWVSAWYSINESETYLECRESATDAEPVTTYKLSRVSILKPSSSKPTVIRLHIKKQKRMDFLPANMAEWFMWTQGLRFLKFVAEEVVGKVSEGRVAAAAVAGSFSSGPAAIPGPSKTVASGSTTGHGHATASPSPPSHSTSATVAPAASSSLTTTSTTTATSSTALMTTAATTTASGTTHSMSPGVYRGKASQVTLGDVVGCLGARTAAESLAVLATMVDWTASAPLKHSHSRSASEARCRLRDLGVVIGKMKPGSLNAITDVPGVCVGSVTLNWDLPKVARTGVTVVLPRPGNLVWTDHVYAGMHRYNGAGEMTAVPWLEEFGTLTTPIGLTNTHQVGVVRDAIIEYGVKTGDMDFWVCPLVAETYDGILNDIDEFHVKKEHVFEALDKASGGVVEEGSVGSGTGMRCHHFKGGIGTSSRVFKVCGHSYTLGVLVQTNYGERQYFRVNGVPVGQILLDYEDPALSDGNNSTSESYGQSSSSGSDEGSSGEGTSSKGAASNDDDDFVVEGSIIVIIATDAPLLPTQCTRLAQRAGVAVSRLGGYGENGSGDLFLAFSTGNHVKEDTNGRLHSVSSVPHDAMNTLFHAAVEATEEAILNSMTMSPSMVGVSGRSVSGLPLQRFADIMTTYSEFTDMAIREN